LRSGLRGSFRAVALLAALAVATGESRAAEPMPSAPDLSVSAPASVRAGEPRDIVVTIANRGRTPVVVLPNLVRLRIENGSAQYVPYPGPALDPWQGAHELAPGASTQLRFPDTSDRRGIWRTPPGEYRIVAVYEVPEDLLPAPAIANPGRVWRGRVVSPAVAMTVDQAR